MPQDSREVADAIKEFLDYGEKTFVPNKPIGAIGHAGYFSGDGWPAKILRIHAEELLEIDRKANEAAKEEKRKRASNAAASLQLAKLFLNLAEAERLIQNEILPAMAHLQMPDDELAQTLELAASNINQTLNTFRLTAGK